MLRADFQFGSDQTVALAAFAHEPFDARSACVAAIDARSGDVPAQVASCRQLGAPLVFAVTDGSLEFWKQREGKPELVERVPPEKAKTFFQSHATDFGPGKIFRAKTWGRVERQSQLSFVDAGLMPLVERETGESLTRLIERVVHRVRRVLWPQKSDILTEDGHWLLKSAFWLLAAKILRDKKVPGFITLDLRQVEQVYACVARHYNTNQPDSAGVRIATREQRDALEAAAEEISGFSHLGNVTTESLAYMYESALITRDTRASLGTHSTPQYLVDYVVWKLRRWIELIPPADRHVFEPACGHAAFLVAAMRLLKEILPPEMQPDRKQYLRKHLHGVEIDPFAMEIARLSLTLADVPNSNGWNLVGDDMFTNTLLTDMSKQATILLGNPPFENFSEKQREAYVETVKHNNKTAEVLGQVLPQVPVGGVFGFIVPQGILHSKNAKDIRSLICRDFEIEEICLFPDKVFSFSDAESAIILGRRVSSPSSTHQVSYRRVREADMDKFRLDFDVSSRLDVVQATMCANAETSFRFPDLYEVWVGVMRNPRLSSLAEMGQGLIYKSENNLASGTQTTSQYQFSGAEEGFVNMNQNPPLLLHESPKLVWMSLDKNHIRRELTGTTTGIPQVLLNYSPVGRGPWRLKALIDDQGHAVTSCFATVRPTSPGTPLKYLWAILNSPLANAYVYAHSTKRHVLVGLMRGMPVPAASREEMQRIASLATDYLNEVTEAGTLSGHVIDESRAKQCLLRMDAEVLRLYDLSPKLERQVLDLFSGQQRAGVPFTFDRYLPEDFESWLHLYEYLSEEFQNSSAKAMAESHKTFDSPAVTEALRRATEDFED